MSRAEATWSRMPPVKSHFRSEAARAAYTARYRERVARWPVAAESRMVDTRFGPTHVLACGPADAEALVLLPGIGSAAYSLGVNAAGLSRTLRVYAVDNIHDHGLGLESKAVKSADDFASWLDDLATGLGLSRFHLGGLSYGGWVATQYALRRPERLLSLTLLAPAGTVTNLSWGFIWRAVLCALPFRAFSRGLVHWLAPAMGATPALAALRQEMEDDGWLAQRSFVARRTVPPIPLTAQHWEELRVRTLFLVGEREVIFDPGEAVRRLGELAPRVQTRTFPGAGHDFFAVHADQVNQCIATWTARDQ